MLGIDIIYREIQYEHWGALYRQIDETPIHYLQPGSGKAQTGYLWDFFACQTAVRCQRSSTISFSTDLQTTQCNQQTKIVINHPP